MTALARQNYEVFRKAGQPVIVAFYVGRFLAKNGSIAFVRDDTLWVDWNSGYEAPYEHKAFC